MELKPHRWKIIFFIINKLPVSHNLIIIGKRKQNSKTELLLGKFIKSNLWILEIK